eukprot:33267_1
MIQIKTWRNTKILEIEEHDMDTITNEGRNNSNIPFHKLLSLRITECNNMSSFLSKYSTYVRSLQRLKHLQLEKICSQTCEAFENMLSLVVLNTNIEKLSFRRIDLPAHNHEIFSSQKFEKLKALRYLNSLTIVGWGKSNIFMQKILQNVSLLKCIHTDFPPCKIQSNILEELCIQIRQRNMLEMSETIKEIVSKSNKLQTLKLSSLIPFGMLKKGGKNNKKVFANITTCINNCLHTRHTLNTLQVVGDDGTLLEDISNFNYGKPRSYKPIKISFGCWSTTIRNETTMIGNLEKLSISLYNCSTTFMVRYRSVNREIEDNVLDLNHLIVRYDPNIDVHTVANKGCILIPTESTSVPCPLCDIGSSMN